MNKIVYSKAMKTLRNRVDFFCKRNFTKIWLQFIELKKYWRLINQLRMTCVYQTRERL